MTEQRKLNDVFTKPFTIGIITVWGVIGSGKTREEVLLQTEVPISESGTTVLQWRKHIGELWRNVELCIKKDVKK